MKSGENRCDNETRAQLSCGGSGADATHNRTAKRVVVDVLARDRGDASGNRFGARLPFELDGSLRGVFIDNDRTADPHGRSVDAEQNLLFLNSGDDRC